MVIIVPLKRNWKARKTVSAQCKQGKEDVKASERSGTAKTNIVLVVGHVCDKADRSSMGLD